MTPHRAYLGDGEYNFALTAPMILELERKTGAGIGIVFQRVIKTAFNLTDLTETIRLALIGGGMAPQRAEELTERYVKGRPLAEVFPLALAILENVWFGAPQDQPARDDQPNPVGASHEPA